MIAVENESFMVAGLERWDVTEQVNERRLEQRLQGRQLYLPPSGDSNDFAAGPPARLPVVRFPQVYSCPSCRHLTRFWEIADGDRMVCRDCEEILVPSRFVVACENGHIDEFPYHAWVHGPGVPFDGHTLRLVATGASAALRDIVIKCSCSLSRSLDGAFERQKLAEVARCQGRRPWLSDKEDEKCGSGLRTLQRGASNVWFSAVMSALSIPPWSDGVFQVLGSQWPTLKSIDDPNMLRAILKGLGAPLLARGHDLDELVHAVVARQQSEQSEAADEEQLREQEYRAILTGRQETDKDQQFVAQPVDAPAALVELVDAVVLVPRLREVRALHGFTRLRPDRSDGGEAAHAPLSKSDVRWLPAIEVRGEGIFLRLNQASLSEWEQRAAVRARVSPLDTRHEALAERHGVTNQRKVTPRLVLMHVFAHALIEQMALDGGYPSASLRERIYATGDMAGLLIYTATSDAAGSLGGIVAQGKPENLEDLVRGAIARVSWCSADPVCIETPFTGADGLNRSACHACVLLAETSCEEMNVLLDRALLVGTPEQPELGFFVKLTT
jgi:hypothetical protein